MGIKINISDLKLIKNNHNSRHPKCLGFVIPDPGHGLGDDFGCEYEPTIDCDECMYGGGSEDPEDESNQE